MRDAGKSRCRRYHRHMCRERNKQKARPLQVQHGKGSHTGTRATTKDTAHIENIRAGAGTYTEQVLHDRDRGVGPEQEPAQEDSQLQDAGGLRREERKKAGVTSGFKL